MKALVLLIVPGVLTCVYLYFKEAQGPYYLGSNSDPEYVYLLNSLNLAQGVAPNHVDHPGTTVQWLGALSLRLAHWTGGQDTLVKDVLDRPEAYLLVMNRVLLVVNLVTLWIVGWLISRWSSLATALTAQLAPLVSVEVLTALVRVNPEPLLIAVVAVYGYGVLSALLRRDVPDRPDYYAVFFAFTCAVGLATKLTFLPLLCLPAVLVPGLKRKLFMLTVFVLAFILLTLPALFNIEYFTGWVKNLFLNSGKYGSGPAKVIDPDTFLSNIGLILRYEVLFTSAFVAVGGVLLLHLLPRFRARVAGTKIFWLAAGLFIAMALQVLMVAKHYAIHYMLPSFLLSIPALLLLRQVLILFFGRSERVIVVATTAVLAGVTGWQLSKGVPARHRELLTNQETQLRVAQYNERHYNASTKVFYYRASSIPFALSFGLGYAGNCQYQYAQLLQKQYPDTYIYNIFNGVYYRWIFSVAPDALFNARPGPVIFQGSVVEAALPLIYPDPANPVKATPLLETKYATKAEAVYEADSLIAGPGTDPNGSNP